MSSNNSNSSRPIIGQLSRSAIGRSASRLSKLIGRSSAVNATGRFLRRQLWAWPIIAAIILGSVGWWVYRSVENAMQQQRINQLTTVLDADVAALRIWITDQGRIADLIAADEQLQPMVQEILTLADGKPEIERRLLNAKSQDEIRSLLNKYLKQNDYVGFLLVTSEGLVAAADQDMPVGKSLDGYRQEFFGKVLKGKPAVSVPFRSTLLLADEKGELRVGLPSMYTAATIRDKSGKPIAVLGLRIRPEDQFTRILQTAQSGETGETYAFDRKGLFLTQSRFDDQLKEIGLLADVPHSQSILTLEMRDPQVDMSKGERPTIRRENQPLTLMVAEAVDGKAGVNVDGYRDYRGTPVVGKWLWLPEFDFGVATKIDVTEAFRPVYILRVVFIVVMGLLLLSAIAIFVAMLFMSKQQKELQKAVHEARRLGQYTLEEKLGAGGMGTVYKARHAMLRRPTAIKMLDTEQVSDAAIVRFEREVQMTSLLNHPNTISIYDFGRTPEGTFYYAMEFLDGINLEDLIRKYEPLPAGRVIAILKQVCGSLAEAHANGLIHRDIKPANIVLTSRGGISDFVKVLDFGLVKAIGSEHKAQATNADTLAGTPLYLSPEAIEEPNSVDYRADIYALGAVGYYLLTGTPLFEGDTVAQILLTHLNAKPEPLSKRLGREVPAQLEEIILRCLAKDRDQRPASARSLFDELDQCHNVASWTNSDAENWWLHKEERLNVGATQAMPQQSTEINNIEETMILDKSKSQH